MVSKSLRLTSPLSYFFFFGSLLKVDAGSSGGDEKLASCSGYTREDWKPGRRLGSGPPWYCEDWEKDLVEAVGTAAMLIVAIGFSRAYEYFRERAEHGFLYGQHLLSEEEKLEHAEQALFKKPLLEIVWTRASGMYMVVGFLSFIIWVSNQQNLFDAIAKNEAETYHLPTEGTDYLHLMEEVQVQLFVALTLFMALTTCVAKSANNCIKDFERCRKDWVGQLKNERDGNRNARSAESDDRVLRSFKYWRGHFMDGAIRSVLSWRERESERQAFEDLMQSMGVDRDPGSIDYKDCYSAFDVRFSFTSYLVYSLHGHVVYFISLSEHTMIFLILLKCFYACLHGWGHVENFFISPVTCLLCFVFLLVVYEVTLVFKRSVSRRDFAREKHGTVMSMLAWLPRLADRYSHKIDAAHVLLTLLQILVFSLCHTVAGHLIQKSWWSDFFAGGEVVPVVMALSYTAALAALAVFVPRVVSDFGLVVSLPPFFSYNNMKMLKYVASNVTDSTVREARQAARSTVARRTAAEAGDTKNCQVCLAQCGYLATWHTTHCCARCELTAGVDHDERCDRKPVPPSLALAMVRSGQDNPPGTNKDPPLKEPEPVVVKKPSNGASKDPKEDAISSAQLDNEIEKNRIVSEESDDRTPFLSVQGDQGGQSPDRKSVSKDQKWKKKRQTASGREKKKEVGQRGSAEDKTKDSPIEEEKAQ